MVTRQAHASVARLAGLFAAALVGLASARAAGRPDAAKIAQRIQAETGVRGGLVVHLGCGDGELTAALRLDHRYVVQGLAREAADVLAARRRVRARRQYGPVSVRRWDGARLPYADGLVSLVVAEEPSQGTEKEILRVLAPLGVAYFKRERRWVKTVKPRPPNIGEWTHSRQGPDANPVARDRVVGPPRHVQWVAGPRWQTHHNMVPSVSAMVSAGGRLFTIVNEAAAGIRGLPGKWHLVARDAFNGVLLWKRPVPEWGWRQWSHRQMAGRFNKPIHLARRLVAVGDRVYVTLGFNAPLTALDAATGDTVRTYERTEHTSEIACKDGLLLLSVNQGPQGPGHVEKKPAVSKHVMAVDAEAGRILWETGDYAGVSCSWDAKERIRRLALAVGHEHAFLLDGDEVAALDLDTGAEVWRAPRPEHPLVRAQFGYYYPNLCTLLYQDGVVLLGQPRPVKGHIPYTPVRMDLVALSAASGKRLWTHQCYHWGYGTPPDLFVIGGLVWVHDAQPYAMVGLDLPSGEERKRFATTEALRMTHHHRCYRDKATERFILTARRGTEFLDVASGENLLHHWVRGSCRLGVMPANGLLYAPPHPCVCYITAKLNGLYALAPARREEGRGTRDTGTRPRLERGPAYGEIADPKSHVPDAEEWPTYRHDPRRSASTPCAVPVELEQKWVVELPAAPSSAAAAEGRLFVASTDTHTLHALDARSGKTLWESTVEGRIDTPPTVTGGLVLFGSADGWVYCLRAADGEVVWRLRAAPADRQVMARGQLESAWPVHGSVLVTGGVAYTCAGRSSFLDGGIHLYALDPASGKVLQRHRIYSPDPQTGRMPHCELPYDMPPDRSGALSDILLTDGSTLYLRQLRLNPADLSEHALAAGADVLAKLQRSLKTRKGPRGYRYIGQHPGCGGQLLSSSGLLDGSWFNQSYWTVDGKGHSRLLVFDSGTLYGVRAYRRTGRHARDTFVPGSKGYKLFAMARSTGKEKWAKQVPVRIRAMVLAGQTLFVAGPPDVVPKEDPWAAFEGRKGAWLWAFSAAEGEKLAEWRLQSPPVLDGMIAAGRRLYVCTRGGDIVCLGGKQAR